MLRGHRTIPNSLPDFAIIFVIIIIISSSNNNNNIVVVVADRKHRLGLLLVSFPADAVLRRRGRLWERGIQRAIGWRQLTTQIRRMVWHLVRYMRRRVASNKDVFLYAHSRVSLHTELRAWVQLFNNFGELVSLSLPSPNLSLLSLSLLPFPSPFLSSLFPSRSLPSPLEVGLRKIQLGDLGSAVSSHSGFWGGAPAEIDFGAL